MQRYPDVYKGAQIEIGAVVEKIIKSTDNEYELLVKTTGPFSMEDWGVNVDLPDDYAVIKGKQTSKELLKATDLMCTALIKALTHTRLTAKAIQFRL